MGCRNSKREIKPHQPVEGEEEHVRNLLMPQQAEHMTLTQFQRELKGEVERAQESKMMAKDPDRYSLMTSIKAIIDSGDVALVRGRWLVERSKDPEPLASRQDLPAEAFWQASDLRVSADGFWLLEPSERRVMVIAVSYCWWTSTHPDPEGTQLRHLGAVLGSYLDQYRLNLFGKDQVADTAVFLDWCSLYQAPRTGEEQVAFTRSVSTMQLWYTHRKIKVWRISRVPGQEDMVKYEDRGWTTFERDVSEMIHAYDDLIDIARFDAAKNYYQNRMVLQTRREPPTTPSTFREVLKKRRFTHLADVTLVGNLFQQAFLDVMISTQVLAFNDLEWDDSKAIQCAKAIPHCHSLQRLFLEGNRIGDEGAQALAEAIRHCSSLEHLRINNNRIASLGISTLREVWLSAGKNAKYLATHAQSRY